MAEIEKWVSSLAVPSCLHAWVLPTPGHVNNKTGRDILQISSICLPSLPMLESKFHL